MALPTATAADIARGLLDFHRTSEPIAGSTLHVEFANLAQYTVSKREVLEGVKVKPC